MGFEKNDLNKGNDIQPLIKPVNFEGIGIQ